MGESSILAHLLIIKSRLYEIYEEIARKKDNPNIDQVLSILSNKFHPYKQEVYDLETDYRFYINQFRKA